MCVKIYVKFVYPSYSYNLVLISNPALIY